MTYAEIEKIIKGMDAHEADCMGASCQHFTDKLLAEFRRANFEVAPPLAAEGETS